MSIERECDACGRKFTAPTKRTRFCRKQCVRDAYARRKAGLPELKPAVLALVSEFRSTETEPTPALVTTRLADQTRKELLDRGVDQTHLGLTALALAEKIDAGAYGSALAAMTREYRVIMKDVIASSSRGGGFISGQRERRNA